MIEKLIFTLITLLIDSANCNKLTYGSIIKLKHTNVSSYINVVDGMKWQKEGGSIVTLANTRNSDLIVRPAENNTHEFGSFVKCGDQIILEDSDSKLIIGINKLNKGIISGSPQVSGINYNDENSSQTIEIICNDDFVEQNKKFSLKFVGHGFLTSLSKYKYNNYNCPRCPIKGQYEIAVVDKPTKNMFQFTFVYKIIDNDFSSDKENDEYDDL